MSGPVEQPQHQPPQGDQRWVIPAALAVLVLALLAGAIAGHLGGRRAIDQAGLGGEAGKPTVAGMGRLEVTSQPPGARVVVDGRLVGSTPVERVDVDPGRHAIVLELDGYAPYTGAVAVGAGKAASLEAVLAKAVGGGGVGGGGVGGGGVAGGPAAGGDAGVGAGADGTKTATADAPEKPRKVRAAPAPRKRDCDGERSSCRKHCDDAEWNCTTRCQYCGSCVSSMTWEQCNNICNTCKQGCEQNVGFCESSCESNYDACTDF